MENQCPNTLTLRTGRINGGLSPIQPWPPCTSSRDAEQLRAVERNALRSMIIIMLIILIYAAAA